MQNRDSFNRPLYSRKWSASVVRYPIRWLKLERDTGVVLGEFSGTEQPRATHDGVVIASAKVGK